MLTALTRLWTKLVLALSPVLPTSQSPVLTRDEREKANVVRLDKIDDIEIESDQFAFHRPDLAARYVGERADIQAQLHALMRANGRGKRFVNAALMSSAVTAEREQFIADRTRDLT